VQCKVLCSLGAGIVENKDVGFGTHIRLNTCSGGLPIIALVPRTTIGRSINIGCAFIALISCSFVVAGSIRLRAGQNVFQRGSAGWVIEVLDNFGRYFVLNK
jgi:hypothetical protein